MAGIENYEDYDGLGLAELVNSGAASPGELLDEALARVKAWNPKINAVVHQNEAEARAAIKAGLPGGPFRGVPFLLKDLGCETADFPTHMGTEIYRDYKHTYESEIYLRIKAAGLVTFGRTTSPSLGIGPTRPRKRGSMAAPPAIRGTSTTPPAGRRGALPRRWPPASFRLRMAATAAARSASLRPTAASMV